MSRLLVVVDMQNDFIDGALGTKEAAAIITLVVAKIAEYQKRDEQIIFTMDTHFDDYLSTQEGKNLPVCHCLKNSKGWEISDKIKSIINLSDYKIYEKSAFGSDELAKDILNGLYNQVTSVELVGICTDICVISNAMLFKSLLPEVAITVDASCCAGVTVSTHKNALEAMKMCQINISNFSS